MSPSVPDHIASILSTDTAITSQLVVAHFKEILEHQHLLTNNVLSSLVSEVYNFLNGQSGSYMRLLYSIPEWIYIKKESKFVSPSVVALKQNRTFKHDLEPYIYILPTACLHTPDFLAHLVKLPQLLVNLRLCLF